MAVCIRSRSAPITYILAGGVLVLALISGETSGHAQSANLALCDRLAADPGDPDKPADLKGAAEIEQSDVATAIKYCKLASAGSAAPRRAIYQLGRAYAANQQFPNAITAYRQAADKGSTSAMVELGMLLLTGSGVAKDESQARELFERAADAGNPHGVINLIALANNGGVPLDPARARTMLTSAAEANFAEAQFQLGLMDANGVGGPRDDVAARALFERAAAQGHPGALLWMGSFAESGRGGPKDTGAAKAYYEKAAALGNEDAKAALKRLQCPVTIKDKRGKLVGDFCF